jgi:hypothetical protein
MKCHKLIKITPDVIQVSYKISIEKIVKVQKVKKLSRIITQTRHM